MITIEKLIRELREIMVAILQLVEKELKDFLTFTAEEIVRYSIKKENLVEYYIELKDEFTILYKQLSEDKKEIFSSQMSEINKMEKEFKRKNIMLTNLIKSVSE